MLESWGVVSPALLRLIIERPSILGALDRWAVTAIKRESPNSGSRQPLPSVEALRTAGGISSRRLREIFQRVGGVLPEVTLPDPTSERGGCWRLRERQPGAGRKLVEVVMHTIQIGHAQDQVVPDKTEETTIRCGWCECDAVVEDPMELWCGSACEDAARQAEDEALTSFTLETRERVAERLAISLVDGGLLWREAWEVAARSAEAPAGEMSMTWRNPFLNGQPRRREQARGDRRSTP